MSAVDLLIVLASIALMEWVAWASHKYLMHGAGWRWHASHHAPRAGRFENNDLFALVFASLSIALIWAGTRGAWPLQWVGAGMAGYGLLYFVAHDGLVHRRWPLRFAPRRGWLKRLVQAHRLHHALDAREHGVAFGFLWAPSERRLGELVREVRLRRAKQPRLTPTSGAARGSRRGAAPASRAARARPRRRAR